MSFSLVEMWHTMGIPAKVVGIFLVLMGLASLTVFIERLLTLRRSRSAARRFASEAGEDLEAGSVEAVLAEAAKYPQGHLPRLVQSGLTTYWQARNAPDGSGLTPVERTRRHLERRLEELGADLRRGMSVLASVGSVAPFVGLLGTVVGIITAFQGIAATGSGGLSSVSAGIAEALVETALGLAVAIPAVLAFNYLSTQIARDELALATSAGELLDTIESWGDEEPAKARRDRVA
jgi:biopolymer transport protein ExbB